MSKEEYEKLKRHVDGLKAGGLKEYGLVANQCTQTAAKVAKVAGIVLNASVTITDIPDTVDIDTGLPFVGKVTGTLWTDRRFNKITFAKPDKMAEALQNYGGTGHKYYFSSASGSGGGVGAGGGGGK